MARLPCNYLLVRVFESKTQGRSALGFKAMIFIMTLRNHVRISLENDVASQGAIVAGELCHSHLPKALLVAQLPSLILGLYFCGDIRHYPPPCDLQGSE